MVKSVSSIEISTELIWGVNKTNNPGCQEIGLQIAWFQDTATAKKTTDNFWQAAKVGLLHKSHKLFTDCRQGIQQLVGNWNKLQTSLSATHDSRQNTDDMIDLCVGCFAAE